MHTPQAVLRPLALGARCLCALAFLILAAPICAAATYYVSPAGNDNDAGTQASPFKTIQQCINNAASGDVVTLAHGTYAGPGNVDIGFGGKNLTINQEKGPGKTVINCGGNITSSQKVNHRAFYIHTGETAVISGLSLKNGYEDSAGGAVDIERGGTATLTDCVFVNNRARDGGGLNSGGTVTLTGCILSGNMAFNSGGAVSTGGTAVLSGCTLTGNTTGGYGGGFSSSGMAALNGCTIKGNTALERGGVGNSGTMTLTDCTILGNSASSGGGGGVYNAGSVTLTGCVVAGNTAIKSNGNGGGVCSIFGTAALMGCTLKGNGAQSGGGICLKGGGAVMAGDSIIGNTATEGNGGGILISGEAALTNCVVARNTALKGNGGGVYNMGQGILRFCTISENSTKRVGTQGGGVENDNAVTLIDDILWGNTAPYASEIGITANGNPTTTATYSDIQGGLSGTGNIKADPLFVSPATSDFQLQSGSPCLGTGTTVAGVTANFRGKPRNDEPDIGAY